MKNYALYVTFIITEDNLSALNFILDNADSTFMYVCLGVYIKYIYDIAMHT